MASILVLYGSHEGQTAAVADYVREVLADRRHDVTVVDAASDPAVAVDEFDAVLVGSPVNNRRHLPEVVQFVERNREALAERPSGFFQLSLAAIVPGRWAQDGDRAFVDDLVERTGWQPEVVGRFAGAVKYTKYDAVTRLLFRLVSAVTTGDTDTSRDYEYTDWAEVETFAVEFAALVDDRVPPSRARSLARTTTGVALGGVVLGVVYWLAARRRART